MQPTSLSTQHQIVWSYKRITTAGAVQIPRRAWPGLLRMPDLAGNAGSAASVAAFVALVRRWAQQAIQQTGLYGKTGCMHNKLLSYAVSCPLLTSHQRIIVVYKGSLHASMLSCECCYPLLTCYYVKPLLWHRISSCLIVTWIHNIPQICFFVCMLL